MNSPMSTPKAPLLTLLRIAVGWHFLYEGVANFLNVWGLILVGLALLLGALTRVASVAGMALLLM